MALRRPASPIGLDWSGYLLGFALGGFFDGILLHQILQWHHLLSSLEGDLRFQIAADGWFHAAMYLIAGVGLWLLWRTRRGPALGGGRRLFADVLIGFGAWHVIDSILSHWVLGIHRIRMESEAPLVWDLVWFAVFGLIPLVAGWLLRRGTGRTGGLRVSGLAPALVAAVVVGAGGWALRPAPAGGFTTVVFRPGLDPEARMSAVAAADAQLVWIDRSGDLAVLAGARPGAAWRLYARGAILVGGAGLPAGCFGWSRA